MNLLPKKVNNIKIPYQMLALLEEMYHELGLVEELDIHPSTLKRWCREMTHQTIF